MQHILSDPVHSDIDARNESGKTALHDAAYKGYDHIVGLLLDAGANVNSKSSSFITPLHVSASIL